MITAKVETERMLKRSGMRDDDSHMLLRPRTNDRKSSKKSDRASSSVASSSGASSSKKQPESPSNPSQKLFGDAPSGMKASPGELRSARAALMFAATQGDPKYPMANPMPGSPKRGSQRSPSPIGRVSGHPLSAVGIVNGPATVETEIDEIRAKEKVSIPKGDHKIFNLRGVTGVSAGAYVFEGGSIKVATTGDVAGGIVDAGRGGKGYLINQRDDGQFVHEVKPGGKAEKAIHAEHTHIRNVGSLAGLEGRGKVNLGAAEKRQAKKIYENWEG